MRIGELAGLVGISTRAVRVRFRGTHSGEFLGFGATGRTVEYVSHEFYRISGGLIAEEWICSDMATLLRQLS
jgi:predicted ester cyclase